ncbi:hypothetical protein [Deinococcus multiflagellatus]|uniref:hypothetical protein n=1 Tax=Deinococcus multiflagellatus TaxID=1656887 RepID=UPI001CCA6BE4|nr:hypothetical protein [Deinococcus multiflagellatus]MBZ9712468.1 hypothetical protein [Deinococcus multiflagellatus]
MSTQSPLNFLALTTFDGRLYAVSQAGEPLALYVFAPLAQAYEEQYEVPFAPHWPRYNGAFVLQYVPMPMLPPEQLPDALEPDITSQERPGDPVRPWVQMLYRGWPLYYVQGQKASAASDVQPAMFQPAVVGMAPPDGGSGAGGVAQEGGDVVLPGPFLGP